ncbi:MAG TPA: efflux RND transporter periplasmic adaptor subunit [Cyclobacteriaceae bacterium]|nr:efflux RND transporter periplasmic adaptor subunit [Cyclobacteriaceae bacterium]
MKRLLVLMALLASCHSKEPIEEKKGFVITDKMFSESEFSEVVSKPVRNEIRLFGKVVADNNKLAHVFPIVSGNVVKIHAELGDQVKQGQVLATIRSGEVAEYERERMDALNDVALAEKNLQVAKDLLAGKLASEKDLLAAERELEKTKAELQRINEIYKIYNLQGGALYNITAPISGFIIEKNINQNELIRSDEGDNVFAIAQIDEVWVLANVNESEIGLFEPGVDAAIHTISYPNRVFKGKVDRKFNILDPATKAMKVRIKLPNSDHALKPEMSATVTLSYEEALTLPSVPSTAVVFDKSKYWVMVFKDREHIETRQVDIYRELGGTTYLTGVEPGEKVFSKNQLLIYDAIND